MLSTGATAPFLKLPGFGTLTVRLTAAGPSLAPAPSRADSGGGRLNRPGGRSRRQGLSSVRRGAAPVR
ncbi:hypothetical protein PV779_36620 [Streptomyces sp. ID01-9D]|nr:hypothetical protein [Streptomyces sp. ID01-9D]